MTARNPVGSVRRWAAAFGAALCLACAGSGPARASQQFDCVIKPSRTVLIGSSVAGVLTEVDVDRGDHVGKGQLLARLEDRVEAATVAIQEMQAGDESSLEAQRARLALSKQRMARARELLNRGSGTRESFDEAEAELAVNQAEISRLEMQLRLAEMELTRARAALALRRIVSPLDGIVVERVLSPGEFVSQDAHILKIADIDPLHVEVFLPVGYYSQLSIGQTGTVMPREPFGGRYEATVTIIDQVFDAASNTLGVRLSLPNPGASLPGGQRCMVELDVEPIDTASGAGAVSPLLLQQ